MRDAMRIVAIAAVAALIFVGSPVAAQVVTEAPPPGRYTIAPEGDGFLRLDTQSGAVSHCRKDASGTWVCAPLAEVERAAVTEEIAALSRRISTLSAQLDALSRDVARLQRRAGLEAEPAPQTTPLPPPAKQELHMPGISDADRAELERALGFMDILMRRFSNMVEEMKRQPEPQKE
jgi:hypothetical protein